MITATERLSKIDAQIEALEAKHRLTPREQDKRNRLIMEYNRLFSQISEFADVPVTQVV